MKQIILRHDYSGLTDSGARCLGALAATWAAYGCSMVLLSHVLPHDSLGSAAAWAIGLLGGFALAAWTTGV